MYKNKKGYWTQQITINGQRKVVSAKSKKDLMLKITNIKEAKVHHRTPLNRVADEWIRDVEKRVTFNTMKGYSSAYKKIVTDWEDTPMEEITAQQVTSWLNTYSRFAQKTIKNILLVFREIYEFAYVNYGVQNNPSLHLKAPRGKGKKERAFPSEEDIKIVNENVYDVNGKVDTYALMAYMALYTGLRRGELCALQWKDIDFDKKTIRVSKSVYWTNDHVPHIKEPKTNAGIREVPIMDALYDILYPLKKRPSEYVFGLLHSYQIDKGFARYQKETGLGVTLHGLRHGFASILYKNNVDIKTAAYVLGHAQSSTTLEIYTHLMEQDKLSSVRSALNSI